MINLANRNEFISASQAAAALGYSTYSTPLDIFLEKTGQTPPFEGNAATKRGQRLEPIVAQYFQDDIEIEFEGAQVLTISELYELYPNFQFPSGCVRSYENGIGTDTHISAEFPFMAASPDRILILAEGAHNVSYFKEMPNGDFQEIGINICGVEIKTAYDHALKDVDDVLDKHQEWLFQAHYNMIITGLRRWYIVWANDFNLQTKYFSIDYSEEIAQEIVAETGVFWNDHVLKNIAPEPKTAADVIYLYPNTTETPLIATNELYAKIKEYEALKEAAKEAEKSAQYLKDQIAVAVGACGLIMYDNQKIATFRPQISQRLDTERLKVEMPEIYNQYSKPTSTRVLRISKPQKQK